MALEVIHNACLWVVTGAYKATPIRHLESEASWTLIDLYLNKGVADFEARLKETEVVTCEVSMCYNALDICDKKNT